MNNKKWMIGAIVAALVLAVGFYAWYRIADAEERAQTAVTLSQEQLQNINVLQNRVGTSEANAKALQEHIKKINTGQVQPVNHFYVSAPNVQQAAVKLQEQIRVSDPSLPPAAIEKTDRTVITANTDKQKVDVYKINTYRNWEWSSGVGWHDGDIYVPIGLQRNFSKSKAIAGELHIDPGKVKITGGEVKAVWMTDKLFFLF